MRLRDYMRINVWLLPIVAIFFPVVFFLFGSSYLTTPKSFYYDQMKDGWTVKFRDFYEENIRLDDVNIGSTEVGDIITIKRKLPKHVIPSGAIMYRSLLSTTTAKINGEVVYEYGKDYAAKGMLVPKHYNFVPISAEDALNEAEIEIEFRITEKDAFNGISAVYYGNRHELERTYLQNNRLPFFIGAFLCMFAFVLLTLSSYLYMYHGKDLSLFCSSLISFCLGAYNLAYNDAFCFIATKDYFFTLLEYISLYTIPFAIMAFVITSHPNMNGLLEKILVAINVLFPIITTALQLLNIVHMNAFVITLHVIALSEALIMIPKLTRNMMRQFKEYKSSLGYFGMTSDAILMMGLTVFMFCAVIDILKYDFLKYFSGGGEVYAHINFVIIGALCFVMFLFLYYFFHGIEHSNAEYMKEHLEGLAYTDALTGLMNRAKCMQHMAQLEGSYVIISLDLDNLKPVNDTRGHAEGDRMISTFADILKISFTGSSLIGRMGGDEFIVVVEDPVGSICESMLHDMQLRMEIFNENDKSINLSASSGYAYSWEIPTGNVRDVFMLADSRMYKEKEEHHKNKLNRFINDILSSDANTAPEKGGSTVL